MSFLLPTVGGPQNPIRVLAPSCHPFFWTMRASSSLFPSIYFTPDMAALAPYSFELSMHKLQTYIQFPPPPFLHFVFYPPPPFPFCPTHMNSAGEILILMHSLIAVSLGGKKQTFIAVNTLYYKHTAAPVICSAARFPCLFKWLTHN